jgi:hypothetical protein
MGILLVLVVPAVSLSSSHAAGVQASQGARASVPAASNTWVSLNGVSKLAPSSRTYTQSVYDAADHEVLVFSGVGGNGGHFDDLWAYSNGKWTDLTTGPLPPFRVNGMITYDTSDGYVLLFGGEGCYNVASCNGYVTYGDTWKYQGGTWTNLTASLATAPSPRFGAMMTYDSADGYVLLYGGWAPNGYTTYQDVWKFHGGAWSLLSNTSAPGTGAFGVMAYDSTDGYVLLYGAAGQGAATDTWTYLGGTWTQLSPATYPTLQGSYVITMDSTKGEIILYGAGGYTYAFSHGDYSMLSDSSSAGSSTSGGLTYDGVDGYDVLVGGSGVWAFGAVTMPVKVAILPSGCTAQVSVNGANYASGAVPNLVFQTPLPIQAGSCGGYTFSSWNVTGKVSISGSNVTVRGPGNITAFYTPSSPTLGSIFGSPLSILLIVIVVVAVVGGVAVLVVRKRRQGSKQESQPQTWDNQGAPQWGQNAQYPAYGSGQYPQNYPQQYPPQYSQQPPQQYYQPAPQPASQTGPGSMGGPTASGLGPAPPCPTCGRLATYVPNAKSWYCTNCSMMVR